MDRFFAIALLLFDMFLTMLKALSFLNRTPYTTFAKFIEECGAFKRTPAHFSELKDIIVKGKYRNLNTLKRAVIQVFEEFEALAEAHGCRINAEFPGCGHAADR